MSVLQLQGLDINGSPFPILCAPDAVLLASATGATFTGSHRRAQNSLAVNGSTEAGGYAHFVTEVLDLTADLIIEVILAGPI